MGRGKNEKVKGVSTGEWMEAGQIEKRKKKKQEDSNLIDQRGSKKSYPLK